MRRFGKIGFILILIFIEHANLAKTKAQSDVAIIDTETLNIRSGPGSYLIVLLPLLKKVIKLMYYRLPVIGTK